MFSYIKSNSQYSGGALKTKSIKTGGDGSVSRTSALIGLSESLWNECIIIIVIIKCEEQ